MRLLREGVTSFAAGVNDSVAPDEYLPNQAQALINARPSLLGNSVQWSDWARRLSVGHNFNGIHPESASYDPSSCYGAIEYYTSVGVQQIVAAFDDEMHYSVDGGVTFTRISGATGLTEAYWSFAIMTEGGSPVLCAANGGSNAYQWDGSTWSTISGIPSGVKYLAIHGNRLIAAGNSGSQVSASKVGDIDTWSIPDGWVVNADDGADFGDVTGLYSMGGVILVFKRKSFGYIEGYGYTTLQVAAGARGLSRAVGTVAHRSIAPSGENAIMFLSEQGFVHYALGAQPQLVSGFQERFVSKINFDAIRLYPGAPSAVWVPTRKEYWCALPVATGSAAYRGLQRNTWIYVFRPATSTRLPAAYFRYPTVASDGTLAIGSDGMLDLNHSDLTGYMAFVDGRGMLDVCRLPDPGLWAELDPSDMLGLKEPKSLPATLFTADAGGEVSAPFAGTYENGIVQFERPDDNEPEMIRNGGFDSTDYWEDPGDVVISGGTATWPGTAGTHRIFQYAPILPGRTYRVSLTVSGRTQGTLTVRHMVSTGDSLEISANGAHSADLEAGAGAGIVNDAALELTASDQFDGSVDDVSMIDVTGDSEDQVALVRTRPLTYGDEFTRKKAKRIAVLAAQPLAHTATVYPLIDAAYGVGQSLSFTTADAGQERRARVGGRGRVIQAELHVSAACTIDGIEVDAQPLGDQP